MGVWAWPWIWPTLKGHYWPGHLQIPIPVTWLITGQSASSPQCLYCLPTTPLPSSSLCQDKLPSYLAVCSVPRTCRGTCQVAGCHLRSRSLQLGPLYNLWRVVCDGLATGGGGDLSILLSFSGLVLSSWPDGCMWLMMTGKGPTRYSPPAYKVRMSKIKNESLRFFWTQETIEAASEVLR